MPEIISIIVGAEEAGERLDVYLSRRLEAVSRSGVQRWIEAGCVTVGGRVRRANYAVRAGDDIRVIPPPPQPAELLPEPLELKIVYEDDVLVVVDKSAGMVVHPGAGNRRGTLANALLYHFREISREDTARPGIVHRLDKGTSGLMVVAKTDRAHDFLARQFKSREVEKSYLALVYGRLERMSGVINVALGRHPWMRKKISTRTRKPRQAVTEYEVIRHYREFTYLRAWPLTGRTHQIRVHFQHLGHPIAGDEAYGAKAFQRLREERLKRAVKELERHFLHADSLSFVHPQSRHRVSFQSPLPPDLARLLPALE